MTPDFEDLLAHLNAESAQYLIVGGYTVGIYAQPRATKDLDIFSGPETANGNAKLSHLLRASPFTVSR